MASPVSHWTVLGALLLADVASPGSCGGSNRSQPPSAQLVISLTDCACAPGAVTVSVDGIVRGTVTCGPNGARSIPVSFGSHLVSGVSDGGSWPSRTVVAEAGSTTVDLGCPTS
jgi:hypothetical protein